MTDDAKRVACPTLVIHARDDALVPFAEGRLLATLIPGARFIALESRNHILLADALVAEGLSNEEVAARLFLSVRTVERHLSNIYTELASDRSDRFATTCIPPCDLASGA